MIGPPSQHFDGYLVHSRYYSNFMAEYLKLPKQKFYRLPLGIDLAGHTGKPRSSNQDEFTIGYFARVCPEKGLKELVDAFELLHKKYPRTKLRAGGFLGSRDADYFRKIEKQTKGLGSAFEFVGSPASREEKVAFLNSLDVLSVPTVYHEPKGLYVLEALANGVPVVEPKHGAFPELIEATGGGVLVNPGDAADLAGALEQLMQNPQHRTKLATAGHTAVHQKFDETTMAQVTLSLFERFIG